MTTGRPGATAAPPNAAYAGQVVHFPDPLRAARYPQGVRVDDSGYPDFSPYARAAAEIAEPPDGFGVDELRLTDYVSANAALRHAGHELCDRLLRGGDPARLDLAPRRGRSPDGTGPRRGQGAAAAPRRAGDGLRRPPPARHPAAPGDPPGAPRRPRRALRSRARRTRRGCGRSRRTSATGCRARTARSSRRSAAVPRWARRSTRSWGCWSTSRSSRCATCPRWTTCGTPTSACGTT